MAFPPPHFSQTLPKVSSTTTSSVFNLRDFSGGGIVSRPTRTLSSHSYLHQTVPLGPPIHRPSYRVQWTDFERQLSDNFAELYGSLDSTDVSIVCGINHEILRAHQFVLSMGSLYFREALKLVPSKHPTIVVRHLTGTGMKKVLDYIYLGQATFRTEPEMECFIDGAKYLKVIGIQEGKYSLSL